MVIDALNGEPGVQSHRWPGYEANDRELVEYALAKLIGVPKKRRTAKLETWTVFYDGKHLLIEKDAIIGYIVDQMPKFIEPGFPWRAILFIPQFGKLYRDLNLAEHRKINHRRKIIKRLKPKIKLVLGMHRILWNLRIYIQGTAVLCILCVLFILLRTCPQNIFGILS